MSWIKQIKASRKRHCCEWCNERIEVGQPKITESGVWEGDFFFRRLHPECYLAQEDWVSHQRTDGYGEIEYPYDPMPRGSHDLKP